ncbi:MAG: STAS/SEC14 domain-containing protein [Oceanicaulis sp.]
MDASTFSRSFDLRFEEGAGLLTARFEGQVTKSDLDAANARLRQITEGRAVNAIILDARDSTPRYSPAELIDSVEETLDDITPKRCAFVSPEPRNEALMLIETVSFPYAVRVQAFSTVDAARDWVLGAL